jgi:hypothetical protein
MMNVTLVRQDESVGEVNIALGEVIFGRGPLLGVSTTDKMKVRNIELCLDNLTHTNLG